DQTQFEPVVVLQLGQVLGAELVALLQLRTTGHFLAGQRLLQTREGSGFHDAELVFDVLAHLGQLHVFDVDGTRVFLKTVAGKDLYVDNGTFYGSRHAQRSVLHVGGLLTEDGTQQFLFRGQLGFALRRYLAHQDVAGVYFSTDVHNAALVETRQCAFAHVGNIGGDFFRTQFGVTRDTGQLLDVDGGETIFLHHTLGD